MNGSSVNEYRRLSLRGTRRRNVVVIVSVLALLLAAPFTAPTSASTQGPRVVATSPTANPLDDAPWPIYTGHAEYVYAAWTRSTGTQRQLLAKIAQQPRVIWFTNGSQPDGADALVRRRIADFQHGNPNSYAQLAVFGLYPKGEERRTEPFTNAMQATYRAWINKIATGIGRSKVIIVLEPDLAVAYTGWRPNVRFALAAYASRVLSSLPNVQIYLDGSDADWLAPQKAVQMLIRSGIRNVRGIAFGATHYAAAAPDITYGATLVRLLAARGYPGKHFVVDTADNGRPLTHKQYYAAHPHGQFDAAPVCRTKTQKQCLTLGIPPTTDVANPRWGMSAGVRSAAARLCDAFLWYGKPWVSGHDPVYSLDRALAVARTTPWQ